MGSKAWLAAAVGCAWDSVITMRQSGVVVTWNDAAVRLFGYQRSEMIGRSFMRIVPPDLRGEEAQLLSRVAHGERISHYESARLRKDGTRVDVSLSFAPVRDSAGMIVGASVIAHAIRPSLAPERPRGAHSALVDLTRDAIVVRDPDDHITFWSTGAERVFGWTRQQAIGRVSHELLQTQFREPIAEIREKLLQKSSWEGMLVSKHRDGAEVVTLTRWTARRDPTGQLVDVVEADSDITLDHHLVNELRTQASELAQQTLEVEHAADELAKMNIELENAVHDAERANRAKTDFLAMMSHELRTPLNAIAGHAQLLEEGIHGPINEKQRQALGRIQLAEKRLLSLVNDVLNFTKLKTGELEMELRVVSVDDALDELESGFREAMREKELRYERVRCGDESYTRADRPNLLQILEKLISNAIRFTSPGGEIQIACSANAERHTVEVAVRDSGIGIPADKLEDIFTPFNQLNHGLTRQREGTGLSLALSRQLAKQMNGELTVSSETGRGSTFTLRLVASDAGHSDDKSAAAPDKAWN